MRLLDDCRRVRVVDATDDWDGDGELDDAEGTSCADVDAEVGIVVGAGTMLVLLGGAVGSPYKILVSLSTNSGFGGVFGSAWDESIVASKARSSEFLSGLESAANNACKCAAPFRRSASFEEEEPSGACISSVVADGALRCNLSFKATLILSTSRVTVGVFVTLESGSDFTLCVRDTSAVDLEGTERRRRGLVVKGDFLSDLLSSVLEEEAMEEGSCATKDGFLCMGVAFWGVI